MGGTLYPNHNMNDNNGGDDDDDDESVAADEIRVIRKNSIAGEGIQDLDDANDNYIGSAIPL